MVVYILSTLCQRDGVGFCSWIYHRFSYKISKNMEFIKFVLNSESKYFKLVKSNNTLFITATVFTTQWDYDAHLDVSEILWGILVFWEWKLDTSEIYRV